MPSALTKTEYWFVFQNDLLLIVKNEEHNFLLDTPSVEMFKNSFLRQHKLAQFDQFDVFCAEISKEISLPDNLDTLSLRKALEILGDDWYNIAAKAYAIITWDKNHQFCGRCGSPTKQTPGHFERQCTHCGLSFYPRISPSIIVRIHKDDEILLARSPHFAPGVYGLIAGFVEPGESVEDAVYREVQEEVGIQIKNLTYYGSQAWPFPDSLMIGFTADYAGGELVINETEIEDAGWYKATNMPGGPSSSVSIARKLINDFIQQQNQQKEG